MSQTVLITGTGRPYALGFNLVRRYLENGDTVLASVRRPSEALEALRQEGYNIAVTGTDNFATRTAAASYVNRDSSAHWSTVNDRASSPSSSSSSAPQCDWRGIPIAYSPDKVSSEYSSSGMAGGLAGGKEAIKDYAKKR